MVPLPQCEVSGRRESRTKQQLTAECKQWVTSGGWYVFEQEFCSPRQL